MLFVSLSPVTTTFVNVKVICWPIVDSVFAAPVGLSATLPALPTKPAVSNRTEPKT